MPKAISTCNRTPLSRTQNPDTPDLPLSRKFCHNLFSSGLILYVAIAQYGSMQTNQRQSESLIIKLLLFEAGPSNNDSTVQYSCAGAHFRCNYRCLLSGDQFLRILLRHRYQFRVGHKCPPDFSGPHYSCFYTKRDGWTEKYDGCCGWQSSDAWNRYIVASISPARGWKDGSFLGGRG